MYKVRVVMDDKGITVSDLARVTGLTRQNINAVILGRIPAYPKYRREIANALGWPKEREQELFEHIVIEY